MLNVHFGDENNLKDKSYVASLAGQMLARGTSKHTRQELKDELDRIKASAMVMGSAAGATIRITTTKENLPKAVDLAIEMLEDSTFPANEFDQLKRQMLAGLENSKSQPQAIAITALQRQLNRYPKGDIRYTPTIEEQIEGIQAVTLDDVKAFYRSYYGAPAGELAVIGEFDPEGLQKQVSDRMNEWKSQQKFARILRTFQASTPKNETFETPDKANDMWLAGMSLKLRDSDPDYPALMLGNYLLGQGMNSRMFARIRTREGLSYGVGSQLSANAEDDLGTFMAYAICAPENAPKVEASFKDELTQILTKGYTAEEVEAAKKSWVQSRAVSRANDNELVSRLAGHSYDNRTMAFDAAMEAKVQALTPAAIQTAMKKYLDVSKLSFVRAGDFRKANVTW